MHRPKKNRAAVDGEKHTLEYTPAQFVGAIAALILFGVICFAAGLIIRGLDAAVAPRAESAAAPPGEGRQRMPDLIEDDAEETTQEPAAGGASIPPEAMNGEFRIVKRPASAEPTASEPAASGTPAPSASPTQPAAERTAVAEAAAPPAESVPAQEPAKSPGDAPVIDIEIDDDAAQAALAAESAALASSASSASSGSSAAPNVEQAPKGEGGSGRFTIQLVAYSVANRGRAESFVEEIKRSNNLDARLVLSQDGKHIRVWVGDFGDRASAERRQEELRQNELFKNCIVKAI